MLVIEAIRLWSCRSCGESYYFANAVFVFANRRHDRIKILGWDVNGFWLLHKRLETERFIWPLGDQAVMMLSIEQLHWLLKGVDIKAVQGHRSMSYQRAA